MGSMTPDPFHRLTMLRTILLANIPLGSELDCAITVDTFVPPPPPPPPPIDPNPPRPPDIRDRALSVHFNHNGTLLAVGHNGDSLSNPGFTVTVYSVSGTTLTKVGSFIPTPTPPSTYPGSCNSVRFSPDGNFLACSGQPVNGIGYTTVFSVSGTTITKVFDSNSDLTVANIPAVSTVTYLGVTYELTRPQQPPGAFVRKTWSSPTCIRWISNTNFVVNNVFSTTGNAWWNAYRYVYESQGGVLLVRLRQVYSFDYGQRPGIGLNRLTNNSTGNGIPNSVPTPVFAFNSNATKYVGVKSDQYGGDDDGEITIYNINSGNGYAEVEKKFITLDSSSRKFEPEDVLWSPDNSVIMIANSISSTTFSDGTEPGIMVFDSNLNPLPAFTATNPARPAGTYGIASDLNCTKIAAVHRGFDDVTNRSSGNQSLSVYSRSGTTFTRLFPAGIPNSSSNFPSPLLCVDVSRDGTKVAVGGVGTASNFFLRVFQI